MKTPIVLPLRLGLWVFACLAPYSNAQYHEDDWDGRDEWMDVPGIIAAMQIQPGAVVADLGCHEGYMTRHLARFVGSAGRVYAVDVEQPKLDRLNEHMADRGFDNVHAILGDYDDPKLPEATLDAIVIMDTYHEIEDYMTVLEHVRRALKPGGVLVMIEEIRRSRMNQSRADQVRRHDLGINYAREELEAAGFLLQSENPDFGHWRGQENRTIWLLTAARPSDSAAAAGFDPPGAEPRVFAPGLVSRPNRFEQNMAVSPDWRELYFTVTDAAWQACRIVGLRRSGGGEWEPMEAGGPFSVDYYETEPRLSPDGNTLLFVSTRPEAGLREDGGGTAIWKSARFGGGWTPPQVLTLPEKVWHPSVSAQGEVYFLSYAEEGIGGGDIYRTELDQNGASSVAISNLGAVINSPDADADPFISADGRVLIFDSPRAGGFGAWDLYASFKGADDEWSQPRNLGPVVNTEHTEFGASLSPDGRYLFFSRRINGDVGGDIYWVESGGVLPELRRPAS